MLCVLSQTSRGPPFGPKLPRSERLPPLPFFPTPAVCSAQHPAGLLHPASGHGVRHVSDSPVALCARRHSRFLARLSRWRHTLRSFPPRSRPGRVTASRSPLAVVLAFDRRSARVATFGPPFAGHSPDLRVLLHCEVRCEPIDVATDRLPDASLGLVHAWLRCLPSPLPKEWLSARSAAQWAAALASAFGRSPVHPKAVRARVRNHDPGPARWGWSRAASASTRPEGFASTTSSLVTRRRLRCRVPAFQARRSVRWEEGASGGTPESASRREQLASPKRSGVFLPSRAGSPRLRFRPEGRLRGVPLAWSWFSAALVPGSRGSLFPSRRWDPSSWLVALERVTGRDSGSRGSVAAGRGFRAVAASPAPEGALPVASILRSVALVQGPPSPVPGSGPEWLLAWGQAPEGALPRAWGRGRRHGSGADGSVVVGSSPEGISPMRAHPITWGPETLVHSPRRGSRGSCSVAVNRGLSRRLGLPKECEAAAPIPYPVSLGRSSEGVRVFRPGPWTFRLGGGLPKETVAVAGARWVCERAVRDRSSPSLRSDSRRSRPVA